jgi:negative regulator of replication initiation
MNRSNEIEQVLDLVRQMINLVKDDASEDDDRAVGRILIAMDQLMVKIDSDVKVEPIAEHLKGKMQIEIPNTKKGD